MSENDYFSRRKFIYGASCSLCGSLILPSCTQVPLTNRSQLNLYDKNLPIIIIQGQIAGIPIPKIYKNEKKWQSLILCLETRKVIFPFEMMIKKNAIKEALRFEELYILSKKEISDLFMEPETSRLTRLKMRS